MKTLALALLVAAGAVASGQASPAAARSDSALFANDVVGAMDLLRDGLRRDSNDVELLWRAARAKLVIGILARTRGATDSAYAESADYARRAVALAPNSADMHYWLAAAQGRRALRARFRTALPLARETHAAASRTLALDSLHAGGHDVMGKLHSEVRKLPWAVRKLAATLTGLEVAKKASWESAEYHLQKSIALDPTFMLARVDLSQMYLRLGRRDTATAIVVAMEKMPARTPVDAHFQREARARLSWY